MPELPEVETIKVGLQNRIVGLTIKQLEVLNSKTLEGNSQNLLGKKILNIWRKAKVLGVDLSGNLSLVFHLKMTGQLIHSKVKTGDMLAGGHPTQDMAGPMPNSSTRVIFIFSDDSQLYFNDQRKFGWVKVIPTTEVGSIKFIQGLGPEPLEANFSWEVLKSQLSKRKNQPVKVALMDQSLISGVGNIYAAEACFDAEIDPRRKAATLSDQEWQRLHRGAIRSLTDGIKHGGSSRAHFVNAEGEPGLFLDYAFVYQRNGQPCKKCQSIIQKITLAGRGTYLCPNCQK